MKLKYAPLDETDKPLWLGAALMPSPRRFPRGVVGQFERRGGLASSLAL